jgi:hypothetical protein
MDKAADSRTGSSGKSPGRAGANRRRPGGAGTSPELERLLPLLDEDLEARGGAGETGGRAPSGPGQPPSERANERAGARRRHRRRRPGGGRPGNPAGPPPVGNTGVEMTGAGLGWLQGTVKKVDPWEVIALLAAAIGWESEARPGGTRWYSESVTIGLHVLVAWAPRNRPDAAEVYFEVHQSALDGLGGAASLKLAADLVAGGARFSRADGYYDDRLRHAEPVIVAEAFGRDDVLTHIWRGRRIIDLVRGGLETGRAGETIYLGSPKTGVMVRVYDKAAQSGRRDAGIRWELQVRHQHAVAFVTGAIAAGDGLGAHVLACIRGLVDFRDRSGQERGDRAPLLDWWAAIVADAERVRLTPPARVDTLERREAWLARRVSPSLTMLFYAKGNQWVNELLLSGDRRLTEPQKRLVRGWLASHGHEP